jgi:glycosyltransferase involved in cell wall biosynthesis
MYFLAKSIANCIPGAVVSNRQSDLDHVDLVVNVDWEATPKLVTAQRFQHYKKLVVVLGGNFEELTAGDKLGLIGRVTPRIPLVVHSRHSHNAVTKFARTWLNATKLRKILESVHCILYGIEDAFEWSEEKNKYKWVVPFNRIDRKHKDIDLHYAITGKVTNALLLRDGIKLDSMFIYSPKLWQAAPPSEFPDYRYVDQPSSRDDYRGLVKDCGMFLCTSKSESFGIYYLELMCTGAVGVFLDKPWVRTLLPVADKLIFSKEDLAAGAIHVLDNYEEYRQYLKEVVVPYIRQTYRLQKFVDEVVTLGSVVDEGEDED